MREIEMKAFTAMAVGDYMQCYNLFTQLIVDKGAVEALAYYLARARCALHMQQYKARKIVCSALVQNKI